MRKRFEQQLKIGQRPISEIRIHPKSTNALEQLVGALKELYGVLKIRVSIKICANSSNMCHQKF